ncbi:MAG: membrane protein [Candidatus Cloacimonadota bacterium]|nr:MAG: membrane protein [Candidatus Cloacimonadota bacterium]
MNNKKITNVKINRNVNSIIGLSIFLFTFIIFFITKAPSVSFWDCGEYITVSNILGVPHPPGNPFYVILGKIITLLPFGIPVAQKVNTLSVLFGSLAVLFTYLAIVKLVAIWEQKAWKCYFAGIIGATLIGFSNTFWDNSIEAEVLSGLSFFISIIVWLILVWTEKNRGKNFTHQKILLLIIYLFSLGFGIHQTVLQIAPAILFIAVYPLLKIDKDFWKKLIIYSVIGIILYLVMFEIGSGFNQASLSKYTIAIFIVGLMIYYLRDYVDKRSWWLALTLVLLGFSAHLILPIRASTNPFINEGDPSSWQRFVDYIFRKQYGPSNMFIRNVDVSKLGYPLIPIPYLKQLWYQFTMQFTRYFSWQFFDAETIGNFLHIPQNLIFNLANLLVAVLGAIGAMFQFKKSKRSFAYLFALFFMSSFAMVYVMNITDHEPRVRPYFFVTAYTFWAMWMGIGCLGIYEYVKTKIRLKFVAGILIIILSFLPVVNLLSQFHKHDRRGEYIALGYGQNILNTVEENAIIFTNGDNDTFPLWYAQANYDPKAKDIIKIEKEQDKEKYRELHNVIDTDKPVSEMSLVERKIYQMQKARKNLTGIRKDVTVANLSLLNTPWYIKQLRDQGGVIINLSDRAIDRLQPIQLPKKMQFKVGDNIVVTFEKGKVLYVKDQMVLRIIKENFGKRPIYFAVTVSDNVGFGDYLSSEGMADRLVDKKGKYQINVQRLKYNIEEVYDYGGIFNEKLYKDENMRRLVNNYGAAFLRMSEACRQQSDMKKAIEYLQKASEFTEDKTRFYPTLASMYAQEKDYENAVKFTSLAIEASPTNKNLYNQKSMYLLKMDKIDSALVVLEQVLDIDPNDRRAKLQYLGICQDKKLYEKGLKFMDKWMEIDKRNKQIFDHFQKQFREEIDVKENSTQKND